MACLCAPTSHEGSFRCRLHRSCPNPIINPSPNQSIKAVHHCTNGSNPAYNQIGCSIPYYITVRESSASTAPYPFVNDNVRFSHSPQLAADRRHSTRMRSTSLLSDTFASSSSSKSSSYRLPSSSSTSSSSSSSRASASSSSPSPSSPFSCTRPPSAKRPLSSSSSPSKSPAYRAISSPSSSWCAGAAAASNNVTPSASHAAAMAIMKQHSHNKLGLSRMHNRNSLSPTSATKIGPSRLSRMAVAYADEFPILKEDQHNISGSHHCANAPKTLISSSVAETPMQSGLASVETAVQIKAAQIGLKTYSAFNKFKQNESSCRIVGSKEGSLIMPTVY